jgi:hypothetical protein
MCIAEKHDNNGQPYAYFSRCYHHNKEHKQLSFAAGSGIGCGASQVMHFGKRHQQEIDSVQHQFNTHEYDDGIAACEHPNNPDNKQSKAEKNVISDIHKKE